MLDGTTRDEIRSAAGWVRNAAASWKSDRVGLHVSSWLSDAVPVPERIDRAAELGKHARRWQVVAMLVGHYAGRAMAGGRDADGDKDNG